MLEERLMIEESMKKEFELHGNFIKTIPGVASINGSIILGKIGDIKRFESAEKLVAFAGLDPVIKESGKRRSERSISKRGDPLLRSAIYMSTLSAVRYNPVISEFYKRWAELNGYGMRWHGTEGIFSAVKRKFGENTVSRSEDGLLAEGYQRFWSYDEIKEFSPYSLKKE